MTNNALTQPTYMYTSSRTNSKSRNPIHIYLPNESSNQSTSMTEMNTSSSSTQKTPPRYPLLPTLKKRVKEYLNDPKNTSTITVISHTEIPAKDQQHIISELIEIDDRVEVDCSGNIIIKEYPSAQHEQVGQTLLYYLQKVETLCRARLGDNSGSLIWIDTIQKSVHPKVHVKSKTIKKPDLAFRVANPKNSFDSQVTCYLEEIYKNHNEDWLTVLKEAMEYAYTKENDNVPLEAKSKIYIAIKVFDPPQDQSNSNMYSGYGFLFIIYYLDDIRHDYDSSTQKLRNVVPKPNQCGYCDNGNGDIQKWITDINNKFSDLKIAPVSDNDPIKIKVDKLYGKFHDDLKFKNQPIFKNETIELGNEFLTALQNAYCPISQILSGQSSSSASSTGIQSSGQSSTSSTTKKQESIPQSSSSSTKKQKSTPQSSTPKSKRKSTSSTASKKRKKQKTE